MHNTLSSLRVRNFRLYFLAQLVSLTGTWLQTIALSWLVYELTDSSSLLGLIISVQFFPLLIFGLLGGHIADRYPKYQSMLIIQSLSIIPPLLLSLVLFFDSLQIWMLVAVGLMQGILRVFDNPVRQSFISFLVPKETLKNAVSLYSTASNAARLFGPVFAAYLLITMGAAWSFLINALSFVFVVIMLLLLKKAEIRAHATNSNEPQNFSSKLHVILNNIPLRNTLFLIGAVGILVFTSQVTFPVFAIEILHGDVDTYGYMFAAVSVGSIIGGLYTANKSDRLNLSISRSMFMLGMSFILLSFSQWLMLALLSLMITGFFLMLVTASANAYVRELSEDTYVGTTMALWSMALVGTGALGNIILGYAIEMVGIHHTLFGNGLLISLIGTLYYINIRNTNTRYGITKKV